jgi:hypothetical protein
MGTPDDGSSGTPISPRDYLPVARKLIEHQDALAAALRADRADDVAGAEQRDAAARDARRNLDRTVAELKGIGIEPTVGTSARNEKSLAFSLALAGAITRRVREDRKCEHARPGAQRPLVASLTSGWMTCRECAPRVVPAHALAGVDGGPDDDGRCDVCDRESLEFSEFQVVIGPVQLSGNMCALCQSWRDRANR